MINQKLQIARQQGSAPFKINDSVHGHMRFEDPLIKRIIDTPELQRLRHLKQMYPSSYVYPSASHTRFEHSLGVCYLSGKMMESLVANTPKTDKPLIEEKEKLCVMIAALCHDLGHGPMSHSWEKLVRECGDTEWEHEDATVLMLDSLLSNIEDHGLSEDDISMIKAMITGKPFETEKQFLFEIVSNKFCDIDVDKWDYLLRDPRQTNRSGFDYKRLLTGVRVSLHTDNKHRITYRDYDNITINKMYMDRAGLHHNVCQHRATLVVEAMLIDACKISDDDEAFEITLDSGERFKPSKAHLNSAAYLQLTDRIIEDIALHGPPKAKEILHRIRTRNLYKRVYIKQCKIDEQYKKHYNNRKEIQNLLKNELSGLTTGNSSTGEPWEFTVIGRSFSMGNHGLLVNTLFHNKQGKLVERPLSLFDQAGTPETYWLGELHICITSKVDLDPESEQMQNIESKVKEIVNKIVDSDD